MSSEGMKKRGWLSWDEVREGRWYWWWNEDPDSCPVPVSVSRSGHTGNDFFATPGQLGWNRHQDLSEMRGWWMPLIEPDPQSADDPDGMKKLRTVFDAGFEACCSYGDNWHHYRGEQADGVFANNMRALGIELKG